MSLLVSHIYTNVFSSLSLSLSSSRLLVVNTHLKALNFTFFFSTQCTYRCDYQVCSPAGCNGLLVNTNINMKLFTLQFFSLLLYIIIIIIKQFFVSFSFSFYDSCTRFTQLDDYIKFEAKKKTANKNDILFLFLVYFCTSFQVFQIIFSHFIHSFRGYFN